MNYFIKLFSTLDVISEQYWSSHTIAIASIASILLFVFYNAFKMGWPDLYFSSDDRTAIFVSASPIRYLLFRVLPVFIAIVFISAIFIDGTTSESALFSGAFTGLLYAMLTDGKAIIKLLNKSLRIKIFVNRHAQIGHHFVTLIIITFMGLFSGYIARFSWIQSLVPSQYGLIDNIWSAIIVAIAVIYIQQIFKSKNLDMDMIFERSKRNIGNEILTKIQTDSAKHKVNPILAEAISIIENIQRPKWVRNMENTFSVFRAEGTYGLMQVKSKKKLSDLESVEKALSSNLKNTKKLKKFSELQSFMLDYNPDHKYVDLVIKAMEFVDYNSVDNDG